jgi:excisionase family DNA binding protein
MPRSSAALFDSVSLEIQRSVTVPRTVAPLNPHDQPSRNEKVNPLSDPLLKVPEVLKILNVSRDTFDKWRRAGKTPAAYRLPNGSLRFRTSAVDEWLNQLPER